MKNKYKTMIYPFDIESVPLVRHNALINDFNITEIISPNGWGLNKKDAGYIDGGKSIGMIIDNDFDKGLEKCDTVLFTEPSNKIDVNNVLYPKIIKAAKKSKNIICTLELEKEMTEKINDICSENRKMFKNFTNKFKEVVHPENEEIYNIDVPVIFVTGVSERTNKLEIQIVLREYIKKMGYKVSQVGTRNNCELMGFHSFPKFMYNNLLTESEKIVLFNYYIKTILIEEKPDVIIIGLPGGIISFNNKFTNRFGVLAYEISQAVKPDVTVLGIPYVEIPNEHLYNISICSKYRFGFDIDCYSISNSFLNVSSSQLMNKLQYTTVGYDAVEKRKKIYSSSKIPVYNILNEDDAKKMSELLINKLQQYSEIEII